MTTIKMQAEAKRSMLETFSKRQQSSAPYPQRTLDLEHVSVMKRIEKEHLRAMSLKEESERLEARIAELESKPKNEMSDSEFDELKQCFRELDLVETCAEEAEDDGDSVGYFVQTAGVLFKYYDVLEKGGNTHQAPQASATAASKNASVGEPRSIMSYFSQPQCPPAQPAPTDDFVGDAAEPETAYDPVIDRATLYEMYMRSVNGGFTHQQSLKQYEKLGSGSHGPCPHCKFPDRTVQLQDGYVFCNKCHTVEYILVDHEKPSYKDPPRDTSYFAYKRGNHFGEWLNQVQGKETTEIPEEVYDAILLEIKKEKITNMATLTKPKIKAILKRLKINKFYEHATLIITRINGIPPPHFPPELEDKLRQMFCQIQAPFLKHAPPKRKNFLSYSYCLRKMVQLLDQDQYIESFSLLKARDKLQVQDNIWKKICGELQWEYYPSL